MFDATLFQDIAIAAGQTRVTNFDLLQDTWIWADFALSYQEPRTGPPATGVRIDALLRTYNHAWAVGGGGQALRQAGPWQLSVSATQACHIFFWGSPSTGGVTAPVSIQPEPAGPPTLFYPLGPQRYYELPWLFGAGYQGQLWFIDAAGNTLQNLQWGPSTTQPSGIHRIPAGSCYVGYASLSLNKPGPVTLW